MDGNRLSCSIPSQMESVQRYEAHSYDGPLSLRSRPVNMLENAGKEVLEERRKHTTVDIVDNEVNKNSPSLLQCQHPPSTMPSLFRFRPPTRRVQKFLSEHKHYLAQECRFVVQKEREALEHMEKRVRMRYLDSERHIRQRIYERYTENTKEEKGRVSFQTVRAGSDVGPIHVNEESRLLFLPKSIYRASQIRTEYPLPLVIDSTSALNERMMVHASGPNTSTTEAERGRCSIGSKVLGSMEHTEQDKDRKKGKESQEHEKTAEVSSRTEALPSLLVSCDAPIASPFPLPSTAYHGEKTPRDTSASCHSNRKQSTLMPSLYPLSSSPSQENHVANSKDTCRRASRDAVHSNMCGSTGPHEEEHQWNSEAVLDFHTLLSRKVPTLSGENACSERSEEWMKEKSSEASVKALREVRNLLAYAVSLQACGIAFCEGELREVAVRYPRYKERIQHIMHPPGRCTPKTVQPGTPTRHRFLKLLTTPDHAVDGNTADPYSIAISGFPERPLSCFLPPSPADTWKECVEWFTREVQTQLKHHTRKEIVRQKKKEKVAVVTPRPSLRFRLLLHCRNHNRWAKKMEWKVEKKENTERCNIAKRAFRFFLAVGWRGILRNFSNPGDRACCNFLQLPKDPIVPPFFQSFSFPVFIWLVTVFRYCFCGIHKALEWHRLCRERVEELLHFHMRHAIEGHAIANRIVKSFSTSSLVLPFIGHLRAFRIYPYSTSYRDDGSVGDGIFLSGSPLSTLLKKEAAGWNRFHLLAKELLMVLHDIEQVELKKPLQQLRLFFLDGWKRKDEKDASKHAVLWYIYHLGTHNAMWEEKKFTKWMLEEGYSYSSAVGEGEKGNKINSWRIPDTYSFQLKPLIPRWWEELEWPPFPLVGVTNPNTFEWPQMCILSALVSVATITLLYGQYSAF